MTSSGLAGEGDGLVTNRPGIALTVEIADCVPIFLYAPDSNAVGIIHAGWRGTALNIVAKGLERMTVLFGSGTESMQVFMGPSIKRCCYQVGADVSAKFSERFLRSKGTGSYHLDLPEANRHQLQSRGVRPENIGLDHRCTCCGEEGFHSYRRDGPKAGRMICIMALT